jgi:hypothetical protein
MKLFAGTSWMCYGFHIRWRDRMPMVEQIRLAEVCLAGTVADIEILNGERKRLGGYPGR